MADYYRWFVPGFAELTSALSDLSWKGAPDRVQWTEQCQVTWSRISVGSCCTTPNFSLRFILQTDALNKGLGAVLSQQLRGLTALLCKSAGSCQRDQIQHGGEGVSGHQFGGWLSSQLPLGLGRMALQPQVGGGGMWQRCGLQVHCRGGVVQWAWGGGWHCSWEQFSNYTLLFQWCWDLEEGRTGGDSWKAVRTMDLVTEKSTFK